MGAILSRTQMEALAEQILKIPGVVEAEVVRNNLMYVYLKKLHTQKSVTRRIDVHATGRVSFARFGFWDGMNSYLWHTKNNTKLKIERVVESALMENSGFAVTQEV